MDNSRYAQRFFPVIVCAELDSPVDALVAMHVPQDEAMDLVVSTWRAGGGATCVLVAREGGRHVAAVPMADGRWAACNAYPEAACSSRHDAERELKKRLKGGRRGAVVNWPGYAAGDDPSSH